MNITDLLLFQDTQRGFGAAHAVRSAIVFTKWTSSSPLQFPKTTKNAIAAVHAASRFSRHVFVLGWLRGRALTLQFQAAIALACRKGADIIEQCLPSVQADMALIEAEGVRVDLDDPGIALFIDADIIG